MKRLVIFDITRIDKQGSFYYPEQLGSVLKTKVESYVTALVYKVGNRIFGVITARAECSDTPILIKIVVCMKRLVIFDLDGTLLNTIDDLGAATNHALEKAGFSSHPLAAYPAMVGNGVKKLLERALPSGMGPSFCPSTATHSMDGKKRSISALTASRYLLDATASFTPIA